MDIWTLIEPHFSRTEKWGDPKKMCYTLLSLLYLLRREIGKPFIIHAAYDQPGSHSDKSFHYTGEAVDFHIVGMSFLDAISAVENALFQLRVLDSVGLGIYPDWEHPGFHLDSRGVKARWSARYETIRDKQTDQKTVIQKYYGYESGVEYAKKFGGSHA